MYLYINYCQDSVGHDITNRHITTDIMYIGYNYKLCKLNIKNSMQVKDFDSSFLNEEK